jgi:hypothetical protein
VNLKPQHQKAALAVLLPIALYMVYTTFLSGEGPVGTPPPSPASKPRPQKLQTIDVPQSSAMAVAGGGPRVASPQTLRNNAARRNNSSQEWTPRVGGRRPEDRADPSKTDPTLRLELLARLQNVAASAGGRSLFDFANAPVKIPDDVKISPKRGGPKGGGPMATEVKPPDVPVTSPGPPADPPPPAIPLKFYGFVQGQGGKRAFFRLGEEEIFMASEGQMIQARYKIVRIGLSSAMVEDTQVKNNQQALRIEEIPKESL